MSNLNPFDVPISELVYAIELSLLVQMDCVVVDCEGVSYNRIAW